jgi:hypothetical protein
MKTKLPKLKHDSAITLGDSTYSFFELIKPLSTEDWTNPPRTFHREWSIQQQQKHFPRARKHSLGYGVSLHKCRSTAIIQSVFLNYKISSEVSNIKKCDIPK